MSRNGSTHSQPLCVSAQPRHRSAPTLLLRARRAASRAAHSGALLVAQRSLPRRPRVVAVERGCCSPEPVGHGLLVASRSLLHLLLLRLGWGSSGSSLAGAALRRGDRSGLNSSPSRRRSSRPFRLGRRGSCSSSRYRRSNHGRRGCCTSRGGCDTTSRTLPAAHHTKAAGVQTSSVPRSRGRPGHRASLETQLFEAI